MTRTGSGARPASSARGRAPPPRTAARLVADLACARARAHRAEWLGVSPAAETRRVDCQRQADRVVRGQGREDASARGSRAARGGWEFAIDAGKVDPRASGG